MSYRVQADEYVGLHPFPSISLSYWLLVVVSDGRLHLFLTNRWILGVPPMRRSLLAQIPLWLLLGNLLCLMSDPCLMVPASDALKGQSGEKVWHWIKDLASDSFEQRDKATRALMRLEDEPPSLREGLKSPDMEVRRRVASILETYVAKRAHHGLKKAQALAKERRVDEMIERLVRWREWIKEEEEWRAVAELAAGLVEWEARTYGNTRFLGPGFHHVPSVFRKKNHSPKDAITPGEIARVWTHSRHILGQEIALDASEVSSKHLVVLALGNVCTPTLYGSILLANGNIRMQYAPSHSIIICEEDLEVSGGIQNCLVIVRGKVTCHKDSKINYSTVLSRGPVAFSEGVTVENAAIFSEASIACPKAIRLGKSALMRTSTLDWPVKFFDPEIAGLTVWQVYRNNGTLPSASPLLAFPDGIQFGDLHEKPDLGFGVQIKKVRKGTPYDGRLHEGEIITAIDDKKTPSKEIFRKVLRRKLAEGGPNITFTMRRTDKILEATWDGHGWVLEHSDKVPRADKIFETSIAVKD